MKLTKLLLPWLCVILTGCGVMLHDHSPSIHPVVKKGDDSLTSTLGSDALQSDQIAVKSTKSIRLFAVGDLQMGKAWPDTDVRLPDGDGEEIFSEVLPYLQENTFDIGFANLETVFADEGQSRKCHSLAKCFAFRVPTRFLKSVKESGFNLVSFNNNHAGDFGDSGKLSTVSALSQHGISVSSDLTGPAIMNVDGLSIAMLAFSTGPTRYRIQDISSAVNSIAEMDKDHDIVIVSFHGGAEGRHASHVVSGTEFYYGEDRGDVQAFARAMVDAGADLVLGHGPHVLRAMELYKGKLIAYSLGNFSSWTTFRLDGPTAISGILEVELTGDGQLIGYRLQPLILRWPGIPYLDSMGRAIKVVNQLSETDMGKPMFHSNGAGLWVNHE